MVERDTHNVLVAGSIPARPIIHVFHYQSYFDGNLRIYGYPDKPKQYSSNVMHSEYMCRYITMVNKEMVDCINKLVAMSKALGEHLCPKCLQPKHNTYDLLCSACYWRRADENHKENRSINRSTNPYWLSASSIKQK